MPTFSNPSHRLCFVDRYLILALFLAISVLVNVWYDSQKPLDTPTLRLAINNQGNHARYIQDFAGYEGKFLCHKCFKLYTVSDGPARVCVCACLCVCE